MKVIKYLGNGRATFGATTGEPKGTGYYRSWNVTWNDKRRKPSVETAPLSAVQDGKLFIEA